MTTRSRARQQRRLIRTADLVAFRHALVTLAREGGPLAARRRALILPSRAAIELLRLGMEDDALSSDGTALVLPELLTRDEWIEQLYESQPGLGPWLTRFEREVLLARAADAVSRRVPAPFELRPGLLAAMLDFYDELGRRGRTIRRFARALFGALGDDRLLDDGGSKSLIAQTLFLTLTFRRYRQDVQRAGALDEHLFRAHLLEANPVLPFDHVIVAVADRPSDPRGLWPADLDLLGRLTALERLDIIVTNEAHDAGFRERIDREVPELDEVVWTMGADEPPHLPILVRPESDDDEAIVRVSRDREEELRDVARLIRARPRGEHGELLDRVAIVFQRPLPYLYLAQQVLSDARVPYQTFDALPLGAEPYAAALDVVLAFARTGGTRETTVDLLRSPLLTFAVEGHGVGLRDIAALDVVLTERRSVAEASGYPVEVDRFFDGRSIRNRVERDRAVRAAAAAASALEFLLPFRAGEAASAQVDAIAAFLRAHGREARPTDEWRNRHVRSRGAVLGALDGLRDAFARHDDRRREPSALVAMLHHWVETQTFTPRRGGGGVQLVDAVAARFGQFDHVHIVGLVETDWPERPRRSVFYTSGLLNELGWPLDAQQLAAQQAAFRDLLLLPAQTLHLHGFELEGDAVVALSPMSEFARAMPSEPLALPSVRVFADEVLTTSLTEAPEAEVVAALTDASRVWLRHRLERPPLTDERYHGYVGARATQAYRPSRVDDYAICPFKYFAANVLQLPEEREEDSGMTPLERGILLHRLFEKFYGAWQANGRGAITIETLAEAVATFEAMTKIELASLSEAERALETTRLLGSIVGRGVAERVFEKEVDADEPVMSRLLEHRLNGTYAFPTMMGEPREVEIRGVADRIDMLGDGSLRLIDYKLTKLPDLDSAMQLAVYAFVVQHLLEEADGQEHLIREATYFAFGSDRQFDESLGKKTGDTTAAVIGGALKFAKVIGDIESGRFPVRPKDTSPCQWCRYSGVCRKEYESDAEAADAV